MDTERPPMRMAELANRTPSPMLLRPGTKAHTVLLEEYRPWRKVRVIARDLAMDSVEAWAAVKASRQSGWRLLELRQEDGEHFGICIGPLVQEALNRIDRGSGSGGPAAFVEPTGRLADRELQQRFRIRTMMDEAAESSLIEGAATTRKQAVAMLRSGRAPKSVGERMVMNNYVAMQQIKRWLDRPLSVEMLLELQTILTEGTLEEPGEAGRLRRVGEAVRVVDDRSGEAIFTPPDASLLPARLEQLCKFANTDHDRGPSFLHPIVKASVLHFMVGYEHPFCDGNGRTARAVFYWFALKSGYSLFEYVAISDIIRKGFARYPQAYIDTELDEGDTTYFVLYKLDVIRQSLDRLAEHIQHEEQKIARSERLLRLSRNLNLRQRLIVEHALRHPLTVYTVKAHMNSNGITAPTARADLEGLAKRRLMVRGKSGKEVTYQIAPGVGDRLESKDRRQ